ncbi:endogenous retrovirus group K member 9 Gag polyprotein [Bos taurus]|uniref:endogenous retrovirus group K member 9 Gag polyprotein n=1 Tax=Bos taurus TaxID=9913 RepID=UPI0028CB4484|nr:endogenous retrovirus group K member 9 Gag polyprotein-like [Bos taurus]
MGQHNSKIPFISIMHHFLKQNGVNVSRDQLNDCYHILLEHNPWFPEEGTLDLDIWKRIKNNVLRAYRQGVRIPPQWWVTWSLIRAVIEQIEGHNVDLEVETVRSLHEYELKEQDMQGALKYKNVMLNQTQSLEKQLGDVCIQDVSKPKPLGVEVISFNGQPKPEVFPSASSVTAVANFARTNHFTPPREMPACAFAFPIQFDQPAQGQNAWAGLGFGMLSSFKKACTLYGPTSPYCVEFLRGWADHWMPCDFFQVAKMVLNPQQLLQWQMWVDDEAQQMTTDQQSRGNPANLAYDILTGTGAMADMTAQLDTITPQMLHFIREISCQAWAKVDNVNSDGSFVKITQGHEEEYAQFIGKLKDALKIYQRLNLTKYYFKTTCL